MNHSELLNKRVEIPVHYDAWMRGAQYGKVTAFHASTVAGQSDYVTVRMDHPQIKRLLKVWCMDWEYMRIINS